MHIATFASIVSMSWAFACGGSHAKPDAGSGSGSGSGSATVCTGKLYDLCNGSGCMPGLICEDFKGHEFMACTETCPVAGDGSSCPIPAGSSFVACTGMNVCSPGAANDCTLP